MSYFTGKAFISNYSSSSPSSSSSTYSWWRRPTTSCTPDELTNIIVAPKGMYEVPSDPYNEVYPGIIIGDGTTALCVMKLKSLGVTHVLNAACGKDPGFGLINTSRNFYQASGIKFLGIEAYDMSSFCLSTYFREAADFIESALESKGKVYVHCKMGISRSSTLVLAFLMIKKGMSAQEAVRTVRSRREIIPNDGFLKQLCQLNEDLIQRRGIEQRRQRLMNSYPSGPVSRVTVI